MPTEHVGFFPSMVLIYSKQFSNAISETTEIYFIFFFCKKKEDYLYARYIQRHYWKMSYLRRLFGCLNTFRYPILMHYNFKYRCVGMCVSEREGKGRKSSVHKNWFRLCGWFVCCCLPPFPMTFLSKLKCLVEKNDIST